MCYPTQDKHMAIVVLKTSLCLPSRGLFLGQNRIKTVFDSISLFAFQDFNLLNLDKLQTNFVPAHSFKPLHFKYNEPGRVLQNLIQI